MEASVSCPAPRTPASDDPRARRRLFGEVVSGRVVGDVDAWWFDSGHI
jgi:hypothetical protein